MESDQQLLLVLLAVRMQGENASSKLDIFKKLKPYLSNAVERQFIKEESIDVTVVEKGKTKKKKSPVINLTDAGKKYLETHAGAEAGAAAIAAQSNGLQEQLQADRETLRAEVKAALANKSATPGSAAEIKTLAVKMDDFAKRLSKLEESVKPVSENDLLARIDQAFAGLARKLESRLGSAAATKNPANPISSSASPPKTLRSILRKAYEDLCLYVEFEDGLVELPRLYHEARRTLSGLTVHAFHQELETLWSQRVLELKVINEVRSVSEPDKALRRGDNLYYYVLWPQT